MKHRIALLSILALTGAVFARADDLPMKLSFDRYKGMLEHSPFAVATAVIAPAATPSFAKDLYVSSAAKSPDGDMVVIGSITDKEFKKYLTTKAPADGYGIASIEWSDKVGETKVTISKDGQYATLTFNQAEISKPVLSKPGGPVMPSFQQPSGFPRPSGLPTPTPHVRGIIQRNPNAAPGTPNSTAEN
jgi:hypothetical protein